MAIQTERARQKQIKLNTKDNYAGRRLTFYMFLIVNRHIHFCVLESLREGHVRNTSEASGGKKR
jgi:hypothetical protein